MCWIINDSNNSKWDFDQETWPLTDWDKLFLFHFKLTFFKLK